ncbi:MULTISPECIES: autotransporter family protein [unclassified Luteibacter]|uniref:autotransporter family protein n=1 Tax=Luteibacter sp. PvP019 TaxID=3156436 RepID=UPI00339AB60E
MSTPQPSRISRRTPQRRRYLAAMVGAVLAPVAGAAPPPWIVDGGILDIPGEAFETRGESESVLLIRGGGGATARRAILETYGDSASAVEVRGAGSTFEMTGGTLETHGGGSAALWVQGTRRANVALRDVALVTEAGVARGAYFNQDGADGQFIRGSVTTTGNTSIGVLAENGGSFSLAGTQVLTTGKTSHGAEATGTDSSLRASKGATITTQGEGAAGVNIGAQAVATIADSTILTHGAYAPALAGQEQSGTVTVLNTSLTTTGDNARGVTTADGANMRLESTRIDTAGAGATGVDDRASSVVLIDGEVSTRGDRAYAVNARGGEYAGRNPLVSLTGTALKTAGISAHAVQALGGGEVRLIEATVTTTGATAHGIATSQGTVRADDTQVMTHGAGAYGAVVLGGGNLYVDGGSIGSEHTAVLRLRDPGTVRFAHGARLDGAEHGLIDVDAASSLPFTVVLDENAHAFGDIRTAGPFVPPAAGTHGPSLAISRGASWTGASTIVRDVTLDSGGTWNVTADSEIASLRHHGGTLAFAHAAAGTFQHLTIRGDYDGQDGLFVMNAHIGDDNSPADLIHVQGNASGSGRIAVTYVDGNGADTVDGIPLIRIDGRSDAVFRLQGRVATKIYEYFLRKGSVHAPNDGNWYLRSSREPDPIVDPAIEPPVTPTPENPDIDPPADVLPPPPPPPPETSRILRPEVGTYRANQTAALDMFQGGIGGGQDDERDDARQSVWARFDRRHTAFDIGDQLVTTSGSSELTLGADLIRGASDAEGYAGVMASTGRADTSARSRVTGYTAKGRARGSAGGLYAGIRTDNGTYVRGWTQYAHLSQRVEGVTLPMERYGSGNLSASIEAGRRWRRALNPDTDVYLEPQAQLTAMRLSGGAHREVNGTQVAPLHGSGATARLGLRGAARWHTPSGHTASPYFTASWLRRLGHLDATRLDDDAFSAGVPRNAYAVKLGLTFLRATRWRMWTDVETRFGANGYRRVTGSLGIRRIW